ncbi:response regulator [Alphaproteobacteria bacterium GH1-50]|uniref:Response regulator n=1 Tax=Kangsaoukella pontilimi TaxID=2691042 RepID=A0A7C9IE38_9RHOB|nr:response regulator [Kangsaoukella pontilimi]MXQ06309.1 response regulator [Kangsaoukella pontilimi]
MLSTIFSDRSILYVEDEIIVALEISEHLRDLGFSDVRVAHTLRAAERELEKGVPDFALLDVNLGNGERTSELGISLREQGTRVLFASGYNKGELSERLQAFDFLEKPTSHEDIRNALVRIADNGKA